jgi:hypothetical protein
MTTKEGENIVLCAERNEKTLVMSIKFDDKVDAAVRIGFVDPQIAYEIKEFYKLRNAIHLESAVKNTIKYKIDNSKLAYRRMCPFTNGIRGFLANGHLPANARPRENSASASHT